MALHGGEKIRKRACRGGAPATACAAKEVLADLGAARGHFAAVSGMALFDRQELLTLCFKQEGGQTHETVR
jgi:hypothetical protein